jgi:hypothetical protein
MLTTGKLLHYLRTRKVCKGQLASTLALLGYTTRVFLFPSATRVKSKIHLMLYITDFYTSEIFLNAA